MTKPDFPEVYTIKGVKKYLKDMNKWRKNKGLKLYRAIAQDDDNEVIVHFEMPEESSGSWSSGCSNSDYLTTMPPFEDGWENSLVIAE